MIIRARAALVTADWAEEHTLQFCPIAFSFDDAAKTLTFFLFAHLASWYICRFTLSRISRRSSLTANSLFI